MGSERLGIERMIETQFEKAGCADIDKQKIEYLEQEIDRITVQRDEAIDRKAELQGQLDRATECIEDLRSEIERLVGNQKEVKV